MAFDITEEIVDVFEATLTEIVIGSGIERLGPVRVHGIINLTVGRGSRVMMTAIVERRVPTVGMVIKTRGSPTQIVIRCCVIVGIGSKILETWCNWSTAHSAYHHPYPKHTTSAVWWLKSLSRTIHALIRVW